MRKHNPNNQRSTHSMAPGAVDHEAGSHIASRQTVRGLAVRIVNKRVFRNRQIAYLDGWSSLGDFQDVHLQVALLGPDCEAIGRGDVIRVEEATVLGHFSRNPRRRDLKVESWSFVERWGEHPWSIRRGGRQTAMFAPPVDHLGWDTQHGHGGQQPSSVGGDDLQLPVIAIIQCLGKSEDRLAHFLGAGTVKVASQLSKDRLVFVYKNCAIFTEFLKNGARIPEFLHAVLRRIYYVNRAPVVAWQDAFAAIPKEDRLLSFPSCLAQLTWDAWTTCFDRDEIALYDENTRTCNTVCYADGYYWLGIKVPRVVIPERNMGNVPSRAYHKLLEIEAWCERERMLLRKQIDAVGESGADGGAAVDVATLNKKLEKETIDIGSYRNRSASNALDLGASPGGWTYCLAKHFNVELVVAVDPAEEMHPLVRKMADEKVEPRVILRQEAAETFLSDEVMRDQIVDRGGLDVVVCDANVSPDRTVDWLLAAKKKGMLAADRKVLVVLTFKNTLKSKFDAEKRRLMELIRTDCGVEKVRDIHLFANKNETTIVGEIPVKCVK